MRMLALKRHEQFKLIVYANWYETLIKLFPSFYVSRRITLQNDKLSLSTKKSRHGPNWAEKSSRGYHAQNTNMQTPWL